jgi:hypothetical protein
MSRTSTPTRRDLRDRPTRTPRPAHRHPHPDPRTARPSPRGSRPARAARAATRQRESSSSVPLEPAACRNCCARLDRTDPLDWRATALGPSSRGPRSGQAAAVRARVTLELPSPRAVTRPRSRPHRDRCHASEATASEARVQRYFTHRACRPSVARQARSCRQVAVRRLIASQLQLPTHDECGCADRPCRRRARAGSRVRVEASRMTGLRRHAESGSGVAGSDGAGAARSPERSELAPEPASDRVDQRWARCVRGDRRSGAP